MDIKALKKISELDVFSLLVFKIIYETGFANLAAKELGVSAPKISRCLTALRLTFDDELFYRRQQGLKPTALAEHLYQPICEFCESASNIERIVCAGNKTNSSKVLNIAVTPIIINSLALSLGREEVMDKLGKVRLHLWNEYSEEKIHQGDIDLGINFGGACVTELESQVIGISTSTSIAARRNHPIWNSGYIDLEEISNYPFLILEGKGFNDKLDPFEIYCRQSGIEPPSISRVTSVSEWFCHLLTMRSFSFMSTAESKVLGSLDDLRVEKLPAFERQKLVGKCLSPEYNIIERSSPYRRYCENSREIILDSVKYLISL
ncbi:HTH-type transcriptional regulator YidZ [Shewanella sp. P1-14-1]|uniref:LysR family transcriptional regulator n=1 Tax=Shewanella TaxID=22 RepID=UPI0006D67292|nr:MULTISPECIES: LysR family transcriptional regulator [Shewanella]KPZ71115.1 HTH-type transcriptional regulator YidZ [Shewanella sp. P1-14-1]